ncbi:T-box transcription factor tbx20 [Cichlidogyrus casuarinus]|uniref:T-box transcription factor tbx20 n=1 Tax=Cichlidogyrus casuarinus TaxID=1844966 RepID=A0ABD2Q6V3_9PLAT
MFPVVRVSFSNLRPDEKYLVVLDIVPVDSKRYRYAYHKSCWLTAGKADPEVYQRCYVHPDSPFTGEQLLKQTVSFEKLKLTNNVLDKHGYIILNSMHKYQPRVHIIKTANPEPFISLPIKPLDSVPQDQIRTFEFTETTFIAVTAYQNQLITKLKIDCNPFAKGFRDSSRLSDFEKESMESLLAQQTTAASMATGLPNPFKLGANGFPVKSSPSPIPETSPQKCATPAMRFNPLLAAITGNLTCPSEAPNQDPQKKALQAYLKLFSQLNNPAS